MLQCGWHLSQESLLLWVSYDLKTVVVVNIWLGVCVEIEAVDCLSATLTFYHTTLNKECHPKPPKITLFVSWQSVDCSKCSKSSKGSLQRRSPVVFFQFNGFEYHWYNRYDCNYGVTSLSVLTPPPSSHVGVMSTTTGECHPPTKVSWQRSEVPV